MWNRMATAPVVLYALTVLGAMAQSSPPFLYSAENSASYAGAVAQGSLFVVFGANIGPAQLVRANTIPLPAQIGGTSMNVTSGSTTLACPMVYSVAGSAAAVMPSSVPAGKAMLSLTYNGQTTSFPLTVNVVPSTAGLYTLGSSGLGSGIFTGLD
jgi:uncharacterized protein (TIGR03437 family)